MIDLTKLSKEIHAQNVKVGWWDGEPCIYEKLQLVSTEIAEATEAERKDLMDDHLPHRKGGEVELADALIRVLDIGGRYGLVLNETDWDTHFTFPLYLDGVASHHLYINEMLIELTREIYEGRIVGHFEKVPSFVIDSYKKLILSIYVCALEFDYDIEAAMIEKIEYNKHRADHKRENRSKKFGKAF